MVLVDTSLWVNVLQGEAKSAAAPEVQSLLKAGEAAWCAPVRMELWTNAKGARELAFLRELATIVIELPVSPEVRDAAIELAGKARTSGVSCPVPDLLITACAQVHRVDLLHRDKHFDLLAAL